MNVIEHDPNEKITKGWHLDKRISVAHILATLGFAAGLGGAVYGISERITLVEQNVDKHEALTELEFIGVHAQLEAVRQRDAAFKQEIIRRLERIEDGVNRHIEVNHD